MPIPRSSPSSVLFSTYNVLNFDGSRAHHDAVVDVIRAIGTDVIAVQEILAPDEQTADDRLRRMAADAGLHCDVPRADAGRDAALALGGHGYHVGLMWRDGIEPVPGSLRRFGAGDFWHGVAVVTLDVGGTLVRHASFHASPFCRRLRADQNERLVSAVTRPPGEPPVLVGGDWNTQCADRIPDGGTWTLYEPGDPFAGVSWFPDMIYQCEWDYDEQGHRRHWADLHPGDVLWAGGLHDAAAVLRAPWQPTTGHHPDDIEGAHGIRRRIDAVRVTAPVSGALRAYHVYDSAATRAASDHLPVTIDYLPAAIQG